MSSSMEDKDLIMLGRLVADGMDEVRKGFGMGDFVANAEYSVTIGSPGDGDWTIKVRRADPDEGESA